MSIVRVPEQLTIVNVQEPSQQVGQEGGKVLTVSDWLIPT